MACQQAKDHFCKSQSEDIGLFISVQTGSSSDDISRCTPHAAVGSIAEWMISSFLCPNSAKAKLFCSVLFVRQTFDKSIK